MPSVEVPDIWKSGESRLRCGRRIRETEANITEVRVVVDASFSVDQMHESLAGVPGSAFEVDDVNRNPRVTDGTAHIALLSAVDLEQAEKIAFCIWRSLCICAGAQMALVRALSIRLQHDEE